MSFTFVTIPDLLDGETGYELDTGDYVAVSRRPSRDCMVSHVGFTFRARWVDVNGEAIMDHGGAPVEWEHTYSALQAGIAAGAPTATQFVSDGLALCLQGGADGAPPDELHPDGGARAKILAAKAILALG